MVENIHSGRIVLKNFIHAKKLGNKLAKKKEITKLWLRRHNDVEWEVEFLALCNKICEKEGISKEIKSWLKMSKVKALAISVSKDVIFLRK